MARDAKTQRFASEKQYFIGFCAAEHEFLDGVFFLRAFGGTVTARGLGWSIVGSPNNQGAERRRR
jgi:hypothetical protein